MIDVVVDGNEVYIVCRPMLQGDRLTDMYVDSAMDQRLICLTIRRRLRPRFRGRGLCPWFVGLWEGSSRARKQWKKRVKSLVGVVQKRRRGDVHQRVWLVDGDGEQYESGDGSEEVDRRSRPKKGMTGPGLIDQSEIAQL